MNTEKVVLVTGVGDQWGALLATRLVAEGAYHVIGLDNRPPRTHIKDLDFIQADIRNPLLAQVLREEGVEAVCHLAFSESERPNEAAFDHNVIGTLKVLGACAEAGVRKVVIKSSTAVYGARPENSAFLTEEQPLRGCPRWGTVRDLLEIEAFCNGFRRQTPQIALTVLRFPSIVGPTVDTPMTRFLREVWTPVLLGFDPMMQVIHEDDVVSAIAHTIAGNAPGVFNVAAEGILPFSQLMSLAGKLSLPVFHLFAYWGANFLGGSGFSISRYIPIDLDYIRYPWVGDLARMREELAFTPRYTAAEALREFAGQQRLSQYLPEAAAAAYDEERLRDTIERRRRARARLDRPASQGEEVNLHV